MATSKAETMFREKTIESLSRLETQMAAIITAHQQERAERRAVEEKIASALTKHNEADDIRFDALTVGQDKLAKKVYLCIGGISVIVFLVQYLPGWLSR